MAGWVGGAHVVILALVMVTMLARLAVTLVLLVVPAGRSIEC